MHHLVELSDFEDLRFVRIFFLLFGHAVDGAVGDERGQRLKLPEALARGEG